MADLSKKKRLTFNIFGISNEQRVFLDNDSYPFLRHVLSPSHRVTNKKEAVLLLLVPVVCTHSVPKVKSPLYWITDYHVSLNHQDKKLFSSFISPLSILYLFPIAGIIDVSSGCSKSEEIALFFHESKCTN